MGYYFIVDNTDECTSIKIYAFTYNPLILQHVYYNMFQSVQITLREKRLKHVSSIRGLYVTVYILTLVHLLALFIKLFINAEI